MLNIAGTERSLQRKSMGIIHAQHFILKEWLKEGTPTAFCEGQINVIKHIWNLELCMCNWTASNTSFPLDVDFIKPERQKLVFFFWKLDFFPNEDSTGTSWKITFSFLTTWQVSMVTSWPTLHALSKNCRHKNMHPLYFRQPKIALTTCQHCGMNLKSL